MGRTRVGLARVPDRDDPRAAIESLLNDGYEALEVDLAGGFWMGTQASWAHSHASAT